jgi:transcriptional regulator with AAA-type ATPase domain
MGLLLQGAALLAHAETAGCRLARGWRGAGLAQGGELCGLETAAGRGRVLCQESLQELVELLFGSGDALPGRGEGRRAVRRLLARWSHCLAPLPPHRAVTEVLEVAPFLWQRDRAVDRVALVAELENGSERSVLLAGAGAGGWPRRAPAGDAAALRRVLAGDDARCLWRGDGDGDPEALAAAGRWRAAAAAWATRGATGETERLAQGEALLALGRFAAASELLGELAHDARDREARLRAEALRLRARLLLGELGGVRHRLAWLAGEVLPPAALVELADIAQRVYANSQIPERAREWTDRALAETRGEERLRAELVAAAGAWDRGDPAEMARRLDAARPAADASPELAWRWHQAAGWRALAEGAATEMVESLGRALGIARRGLHRHQAAGLWSDLGVGRARAGDLPGAERAFLHAQRLLAGCDGPRQTTLALHNLAEIRLRRGRVAGVEEILARSLEENRLAGNLRGQVHDLALLVRYELVLGRLEEALAHAADVLELLERRGVDWHRSEIRLLQARARGWLGRKQEAAEALAEVAPESLGEIEPEEWPALFALAGDLRRGLELARSSGLPELWRALLEGAAVPSLLWRPVEALEPYRAARLVLDAETLRPGVAPPQWRRRAAVALRRIGALAPAERLELTEGGAFEALACYLETMPRGLPDLRRLFARVGHPEARIERMGRNGEPGPEVLVGGAGGAEELSVRAGDGLLVLRVRAVDATVRACFAVAARDLDGGRNGDGGFVMEEPQPALPRRGAGRDGLIGESLDLRRAVERAERLACGDLPVLILGESGTGKELVARLVHRRSPRCARPFVAINCAAVSETLLLSDLFGHVRGAFTGAERDREGVFEAAQGGTVFLDEVGDLPPAAQGVLLRVVQEGEVRRVGESLPRKVDARVVAATHRDLAAMVEEGSFRQDLFFRLNVARVELPPLRHRGGDVVLLAEHLLARVAPGARLGSAVRHRLLRHPWPGNVRELENVLEVAAALAGGGEIRAEHLELPDAAPEPAGHYQGRVEAFRRRLVREALDASDGNQAEAARRLGLTRQALSYLVKQLRLR